VLDFYARIVFSRVVKAIEPDKTGSDKMKNEEWTLEGFAPHAYSAMQTVNAWLMQGQTPKRAEALERLKAGLEYTWKALEDLEDLI
jgi:hypothetical protein